MSANIQPDFVILCELTEPLWLPVIQFYVYDDTLECLSRHLLLLTILLDGELSLHGKF